MRGRGREKGRGCAHVIDVAPASCDEIAILCQFQHFEVVDEMAVREATLRLESEPLEDLHFGDDDGLLCIVEFVGKVVHGHVGGEGGGRRVGSLGAVRNELEEVRVAVDEVADSERGFL